MEKSLKHLLVDSLLMQECKNGNLLQVEELLRTVSVSGNAFTNACENGHGDVVELLIQHTPQHQLVPFMNLGFVAACKKDQLNVVKFLTHTDIELSQSVIEMGLVNACHNGHVDIVHYLLTAPHLELSIDCDGGELLSSACKDTSLAMLRYLLTSPDLLIPDKNGRIVGHADIHANNDSALKKACFLKNTAAVKYLLSAPELLVPDMHGHIVGHANINISDNYGLHANAGCGFWDNIEYFLSFPQYDVHADQDRLFMEMCTSNQHEMIKYMIFEYKIELTEDIASQLQTSMEYRPDMQEILNMFTLRDLHDRLDQDLVENKKMKKHKL